MRVTTSIEGLVFDLDGTLAATEPLHEEAWLSVLYEQGLTQLDSSWFEQWVGHTDNRLAASVVAEFQLAADAASLQDAKRRYYHARARKAAQLFPAVGEGLSALAKKYPIALATSSSDADADAVFSGTGIDQYFRSIVTCDRVAERKPAPECYLLACRELGLPPKNCIAFEDSPAGVEAAYRAGLTVLAILSSKTKEELSQAHHHFGTTREAMDWVLGLAHS